MRNRLPVERLNNDFAMQFLAMRYLLLGFLHNQPVFAKALLALESAVPYVTAYNATGFVEPTYRRKLMLAFDLYPHVGDHLDRVGQLVELLTPDFEANPALAASPSLDESDSLEDLTPAPISGNRVTGQFDKLFISMQYFLHGMIAYDRSFQVSYDSLMYASEIHVGVRKDGKTPEFQHQLEIGHLVRTMLRGLIFPAETLASIFLHDTPEDYGVKRAVIETKFGPRVAHSTGLMNKYDDEGNPKPLEQYYAEMADDPIASVAKPADNAHNQSTMSPVFSYKKQYAYTLNIRTLSWPMIKAARRKWPEQEAVYENLKCLLRVQYNAVHTMLQAVRFDPTTGEIHPALTA